MRSNIAFVSDCAWPAWNNESGQMDAFKKRMVIVIDSPLLLVKRAFDSWFSTWFTLRAPALRSLAALFYVHSSLTWHIKWWTRWFTVYTATIAATPMTARAFLLQANINSGGMNYYFSGGRQEECPEWFYSETILGLSLISLIIKLC